MARRTDMTDREKMIDLIINAKKSDPETGSFAEYLANFLLGYGVKLPTSHPGKPLTLDQLREMDGQPVWVEFIGHPDGTPIEPLWMLVNSREKRLVTDVEYVDWNSEGWFAYSYPPAHIDRGEWTAEWIYPENEWNLPRCSKCGCNSKDATYGHKDRFCPKCGRAMTEEAWAKLERRLQRTLPPEPPEEG